jgi:hydroxylysine kinase
MTDAALDITMTAGDSRTPVVDVERWLREHYGLEARAERIATERDEQFLVRDAAGSRYILKLTNPHEIPQIIDMQTQALLHVARVAPTLPTPRVVPTLDQQAMLTVPHHGHDDSLREGGGQGSDQGGRLMRLLTYLDGRFLSQVPRSPRQAYQVGALLARLGVALKSFSHPHDSRSLNWDLARAADRAALLPAVADPQVRARAAEAIEVYQCTALPALGPLRSQVVHNDFNPHNLLVSPLDTDELTGIIDFGDVVRTQLINDVAIAASYLLTDGADPLDLPISFIKGYHSVTPLTSSELALLPSLMATRLAITVVITEWRARRYPHNRAYITKNTPYAAHGLALLAALPDGEAAATFARMA